MKMFISNEDHYDFIKKCVADNPEHIFISTFGIYAGITYDGRDTAEWGENYRLDTRDILEEMQSLDNTRMLVGVADYRSCKGFSRCLDCEKQYIRNLFRLSFHAEKFPGIEWRITTDLHLKCSLFFYDVDCSPEEARGVAGGRNFTNSSWADITFKLNSGQIEQLHDYCHKLWEQSKEASDDSVGEILEIQGISEDGIKEILR